MSKIVQLCRVGHGRKLIAISIMLLSPAVLALSPLKKPKDCSGVLSTKRAPVLDYAISDLEGLFFELIEKVQTANEIEAGRHEKLVSDILNLKAHVLNSITDLLPLILRIDEPQRKAEIVFSVYQILDSMGVPPQLYGLKLDKDNNLLIPQVPQMKAAAEKAVAAANDNEFKPRPIGFLTPSKLPRTDVAEGEHRSIGFAPHSISTSPPPLRRGGQIVRKVVPQAEHILLIADGETGQVYQVDLRILTSAGAALDGKTLELDFNKDIMEWIVLVKNLNNPSGKIGFL